MATKTIRQVDLQHVGPGHWVAYSGRDHNKWYHLRRSGRTWTCECLGYINHGHCYHRDGLNAILTGQIPPPQDKVIRPNDPEAEAFVGAVENSTTW